MQVTLSQKQAGEFNNWKKEKLETIILAGR
jgi:hypothetical protein